MINRVSIQETVIGVHIHVLDQEIGLAAQGRSITVEEEAPVIDMEIAAEDEGTDHRVASTLASTAAVIVAVAVHQVIVTKAVVEEGAAVNKHAGQKNQQAEMHLGCVSTEVVVTGMTEIDTPGRAMKTRGTITENIE